MRKIKNRISLQGIILNLIMFVLSLCFIIPLSMIISASLTGHENLAAYGYPIIPRELDFTAYKYALKDMTQIINSYKTTMLTACVTCVAGTLIMCMAAYALSRKYFVARKQCTFIVFFTMLFAGGLIPTYIIYTQWYHLGDTYWVYILPCLCSAWHIIIIRTFFAGIPDSLCEAAKIDGASEFRIFFTIMLPLSKPVIATVALLTLLTRWNDWNTSLIFIRDSSKYSLQYLLQRILNDVKFVQMMSSNTELAGINDIANKPEVATESLRFAMVIIAAGPMLVIFPFFQKYFARGLTVGAVKG